MLDGNTVHTAILGLAQKQAVQPPNVSKMNIQTVPTALTISQPPAPNLTVGQQAPVQMLSIGQQAPVQTLNIGQQAPIKTLSIGQQAPIQTLTIGQQPAMTLNTSQIAYPTADAYKKYDHRTHVYMKPDTYIGADEKMVREEWLFDRQNLKMVNTTIDFVPGCERLFLEVLTNASDNVGRSRRAGVDPGKIDITMDNSTITIINHGLPIPVEMHPEEKVYVPQMIFGSLLTSSNYTQDRHEAGTNGIGAKAANIFSKEFLVIVKDHIRNLKYTQSWRENMTICNDPIIEPYTGTVSSVQITYKMDFARFKYPLPQDTPQATTQPSINLMISPKASEVPNTETTLTLNTAPKTLTLNVAPKTLTLNTAPNTSSTLNTAPITLTIGGTNAQTAPTVKGIKGVATVVEAKNGGYTAEAFALFARHAIDISFTAKTTVTFNGQEFNFSSIRDYARLYFGECVDTAILHYQWPHGTEIVHKKKGVQVAKNPCIMPEIELIAIDTPDEGHHVSFVNCMMTRDGGVHVNSAVKAVGDSAVKMINDSMLKKLSKQNKGKELDAKEKRSHTITINDVKPHISILLNAKVTNPKFTSQTKTVLHSPTPKIDVPDEELKSIGKWQLIERLYAALDAKQFASMAKNDGKLKKRVKLLKGEDANNAGHAQRHQCILYITEGDSGAGYAERLMALMPGGKDFIGILPMRGKSLNVMNADRFQIEKNNEINELKKMLGLCEGMDYSDGGNFNKLRYGGIMIMADSDVDGKHIIGLIINFFFCRFPSLLKRNYVMHYRTPTIRVTFNRVTLKFYTEQEYEDWKNRTPNYMKWSHNYYKGLGSSENEEVKDDFNNPKVVTFRFDDKAPDSMNLAFAKKFTDKRKDWIEGWRPLTVPDNDPVQDITKFINHELILFSLANIERAIPRLDGFKESLRKIMEACHQKWKIGSKKKSYERIKVAQFAAFVAEKTSYQHGESILGDVIIGMAQDFIGSNNIPWFTKEGQFGTRTKLGANAAAPRYLHTRPTKLTSLILRKEDRPILKHLVDEGMKIEPETYYPVIPMILINGTSGIATGYSSFVPCHNPLDVIAWLKARIAGVEEKDLPTIFPWYRGFTGTIKVVDRRNRKKRGDNKVNVTIINNVNKNGVIIPEVHNDLKEDEGHNEEEEKLSTREEEDIENKEDHKESAITNSYLREQSNNTRPLLSMVTIGKFYIDSRQNIIITELPIGRGSYDYHKWLAALVEEKQITDFRDLSGNNDGDGIYFEIYGFKGEISEKTLKLQRSMGMSNMVLLNENNKPVRYDTTKDILEAFYVMRLPIYQKRKDYILQNLTEEIITLNHRVRFIQAILDGIIVVINNKIANVRAKMDELGIPREIYEMSKTRHLSEDDIKDFQQLIFDKEQERERVLKTPISETWLNDLEELETAYRHEYGFKKPAVGQDGSVTLTIKPTAPLPPPPTIDMVKRRGRQPRKTAPKTAAPTPAPQTIALKVMP